MEEDDLYRFSNPNFLQSSDIRFRVDGRAASPSFWLSTSTSMATAAEAELAHVTELDRRAEIDRQTADHVSDSGPDLIKAQISTHPRYPHLVSAYIECQKVGTPPEFASLLQQLNHQIITLASSHMGAPDPELDDFMESFCEVLHRYKEELSKPFDDATTFLSYMESELNNLCNGSAMAPITRTTPHNFDHSDEAVGSSDEEAISCGEREIIGVAEGQECWPKDIEEGEHDIRGMLMRKYGGYLGSLRKEFMSKRKKGKLPKDAISALVDWWNLHHRWPYPTEEDKSKLSEITGLDQKQINNWFINQRKRHWKPSQDLKAALLEGLGANRSVDSDHDNGQARVSQDSTLN